VIYTGKIYLEAFTAAVGNVVKSRNR